MDIGRMKGGGSLAEALKRLREENEVLIQENKRLRLALLEKACEEFEDQDSLSKLRQVYEQHLWDYQIPAAAFVEETLSGRMQQVRSPHGASLGQVINYGCVVADPLGFGKTIEVLSGVYAYMLQNTGSNALIIAPTYVSSVWLRDITLFNSWVQPALGARFGFLKVFNLESSARSDERLEVLKTWNSTKGVVLVIGYELFVELSNDLDLSELLVATRESTVVIVDEAHRLRNFQAQSRKALLRVNTRRRVLISGFPLQNDVMELYNIIQFCSPELCILLLEGRDRFKMTYHSPFLKSSMSPELCDKAERRFKLLSSLLSSHHLMIRRSPELLCRRLPELVELRVDFRFSFVQRELYNECIRAYESGSLNLMDTFGMLSMIGAHPVCLCDSSSNDWKSVPLEVAKRPGLSQDRWLCKMTSKFDDRLHPLVRNSNSFVCEYLMRVDWTNWMHQGPKMITLKEIIGASLGDQECVLVCSRWLCCLDLIHKFLLLVFQNIRIARIDGGSSILEREKSIRDLNQGLVDVVLLSTHCGEGINLSKCSRVVLMDSNWNPSCDIQAALRVFREGQRKRTFLFRFSMDCGIEPQILSRQNSKLQLFHAVIDRKDASLAPFVRTVLEEIPECKIGKPFMRPHISVPKQLRTDRFFSKVFLLTNKQGGSKSLARVQQTLEFFPPEGPRDDLQLARIELMQDLRFTQEEETVS